MNYKICGDCSLGEQISIVGDGVTEPPYMSVIRCPYDNEYYKDPDDECNCSD